MEWKCDRTLEIKRTPYPFSTAIQHMNVNHRRLDILVSKQFLNRTVVPRLHKELAR